MVMSPLPPFLHPFVLSKWLLSRLGANYGPYPDGNVPRQGLYFSYRRVCDQYGIPHINTATLGKAIRLCFPTIKTRRLGVRGNSKYHCKLVFPSQSHLISIIPRLWYTSGNLCRSGVASGIHSQIQ